MMDPHYQLDAPSAATLAAIQQFNDAFSRHDVPAIMAAMTDDCLFEDTKPPPDGGRYIGQAAVRAYWERFFRESPHAVFDTEDLFVAGDRGTVHWIYHWIGGAGTTGHIRGVDVFRVREGKVAEKLAYVKG